MPVLPCPACGRPTARHLHDTSKIAIANYYRCETCGHIWTVNKIDPSKVFNVTPLPKPPAKAN